MKKEEFRELVEKLKGLNWCFVSGAAVCIYSRGKRKAQDLDILIHPLDIYKAAERFGEKVNQREVKKGDLIITDRNVRFTFIDQPIEFLTSASNDEIQDKNIQIMLDNKKEADYLGSQVFLTPIEELITQKASMQREKDIADLNLLKEANISLNMKLFNHFLAKWGNKEKALILLNKLGYKPRC